ncbi:hypothetical protein D3C83_310270 [compost metagenome]
MGCLVMAAAVLGLRVLLPESWPLAATTALSIAAGVVVYPAVIWFAFGPRVRSMLDVARKMRSLA